MKYAALFVLSTSILAGCTTGPGLWSCDILVDVLENVNCELDCRNKYYNPTSKGDYAYERCLYECKEAITSDQCTKAAEEAKSK